jgi:uncharacterized Zn finger protein
MTCPECDAVHDVIVRRYPAREPYTLYCRHCGAFLEDGNDTRDPTLKLTKPGRPEMKDKFNGAPAG